MNKNKVITYSLLAHINSNRTISNNLFELFVPLVKRAIHYLNEEGISSGQSIIRIKEKFDSLYGFDIPIPVLSNLLQMISDEVNKLEEDSFFLYKDYSFAIKNYIFVEFDEIVEQKKSEILRLEKLFKIFKDESNISDDKYSTIFEFIETNKLSLSKYLGSNKTSQTSNSLFLIEARFVEYFRKIPVVYGIIRNIYIGSIISTYLEFNIEVNNNNIELVFDTNFMIGLYDLNTPESLHTCNQLISISKQLGFKLSILDVTVTEITNLLLGKAEGINNSFIQPRVNPEDIYNACHRRGLDKTDLQRFADNLPEFIESKGIILIPNTLKYQNKAKYSNLYKKLVEVRSSKFAALHDATMFQYVESKRGKIVYNFEDVNCWSVHNSVNNDSDFRFDIQQKQIQSYHIKVDDLLNILWLSNPGFSSLTNVKDLSDFGLNTLISCTISDSLPKARVIRELDENISKYIKDDSITEKDVLRLATRISNRNLTNIEELNKLHEKSNIEFIKKIKEEADLEEKKEEEIKENINKVLEEFSEARNNYDNKFKQIEDKEENFNLVSSSQSEEIKKLKEELKIEENKRLKYENEQLEIKKDKYIEEQVYKWRKNTWIELSIGFLILSVLVIYIMTSNNWSFEELYNAIFIKNNTNDIVVSLTTALSTIYTTFIGKSLWEKYRNHSNINAYKAGLKIPKDL
ncbi:hypothetical protein Fleli_1690 [Bernardetia litoralis DSM 6794]|uniref:Uncharacterized protein n=1 Tax=Bernardetia litoralis (strain ATCC 23117 / DSM 6794 / NBRC 15988 / NCIMB 1366 / Fx l1 / Sio-4) TaxID=880071 RepID=I4AJG3_BERLS|nr:hypothetical protein [Bernardetia litoralis]AFM04098.1 hypothetical protein Fleli_1690 [Bernardetia litoralis DSM 6794]